jgi:formylglycine-generating enzyme required for sulfatase activity/Flp pilus assembly protein TadD
VSLVAIILSLVGWINHSYIADQWRWWWTDRPFVAANIWPYVLSTDAERALKADPNQSFRECVPKEPGKDYCPDMIVVPGGSFIMGSSVNEPGHGAYEEPQHEVTFEKPFAVSKFQITFGEWDTCVAAGGCNGYQPDDLWGRDQQPVINVNLADVQLYVAWFSRMTGKSYHVLSEAEYEYAARGGTMTAYPWGDDIKLNGTAMANCFGCETKWRNGAAPVGSYPPNGFGLYDMVGNLQEWVQDCWHNTYNGAPTDGSPWLAEGGGRCRLFGARGGGWSSKPDALRSADRSGAPPEGRTFFFGFRIARRLDVAPTHPRQELTQQQFDWCDNKGSAFSPDLRISGCTVAIESGKWTGKDLAWLYVGRANAYVKKVDYDHAIIDYTAAIRLDLRLASIYFGRGRMYGAKKDYDHAIADLAETINLDPKDGAAYNLRCWYGAITGRDLRGALADCNESLRLRPDNADAFNSRGLVEYKLGAFQQAIADDSAALAQDAKDAESLYVRGMAKLKIGDAPGGDADIAAAKAIQPDIAKTYADYGVM